MSGILFVVDLRADIPVVRLPYPFASLELYFFSRSIERIMINQPFTGSKLTLVFF
jgi:hypothetical protein